jgi:transposase
MPPRFWPSPAAWGSWTALSQQINTLEQTVHQRLKRPPASEQRLTVDGIGAIWAQTIVLATGDISRFPTVGTSASSCRCVKRTKMSHGKRKGQGNGTNGHPSLEWASMEAAQFAIRFSPQVQRFPQRKEAKSHRMLARKAVAHTRSRACYDILRDLVPFDVDKAFG